MSCLGPALLALPAPQIAISPLSPLMVDLGAMALRIQVHAAPFHISIVEKTKAGSTGHKTM